MGKMVRAGAGAGAGQKWTVSATLFLTLLRLGFFICLFSVEKDLEKEHTVL
jgi:hypothetical protein